MGEQRPADGHALLLAPRKGIGSAFEQGLDIQKFDHRRQIRRRAAVRPCEPATVKKVLANTEVGKQPAVLEDIADPPAVAGNEHPAFGVDEHLAVNGNAASCRANEAADDVDQRRLARPRAAKQRREAGLGGEACREPEVLTDVIDVDVQAHATAVRRAPIRRASTSDPRSASMDIAIDISVRRSAPASPPGTCVKV